MQNSKALDQLNKLRNFLWNHVICALRVQRACKWCKDFCFTKSSFLIWLTNVNVFEEWCQRIRRMMSMYQRVMSVYHYSKFDIDDYLKKFKTRLCVKNNFQSIDQNTYATIFVAKTFRALMIISIAFDLKI